jgi:hypothetical protein
MKPPTTTTAPEQQQQQVALQEVTSTVVVVVGKRGWFGLSFEPIRQFCWRRVLWAVEQRLWQHWWTSTWPSLTQSPCLWTWVRGVLIFLSFLSPS